MPKLFSKFMALHNSNTFELRLNSINISSHVTKCCTCILLIITIANHYSWHTNLWYRSPVTSEFPTQRSVTRSFDARMNDWINNREAGDLRRHRTHYVVTIMHFWTLMRSRYLSFLLVDVCDQYFLYVVYSVVADNLAMLGARASATMVLTSLYPNISM